MTPSSLRALADLLDADPSLVAVGSFRLVSGAPRTRHAERQARYRLSVASREASREASRRDALLEPSPDNPSDLERDPPITDSSFPVAKSLKEQKNPETQKELPGNAGAREGGARGDSVTSREGVTRKRITRHAAQIDPPAEWSPNARHAEQAAALRLDLAREAEKFRLYPNRRKPVRDWDRAFSWWLHKSAEFGNAAPRARHAPANGHSFLPGETPMERVARMKREAVS